MMSLSSKAFGNPIQNFSVSSARLPDIYALAPSGIVKSGSDRILIGLDPWILRVDALRVAWPSLDQLSRTWQSAIASKVPPSQVKLSQTSITAETSILTKFYDQVNLKSFSLISQSPEPELISKKAWDGHHIYDSKTLLLTVEEVLRETKVIGKDRWDRFSVHPKALHQFRDLVAYLKKNGVKVVFFLTPYHPYVYERVEASTSNYSSAEDFFRNLAMELQVEVVGSYDPSKFNCNSTSDFLDGTHPTTDCLKKLVRASETRRLVGIYEE
jgi:hypothetical protein